MDHAALQVLTAFGFNTFVQKNQNKVLKILLSKDAICHLS